MSATGTEAITRPPSAGRELGFWMCTALVVGNIIGMGIFVLPASLAPFGFNATIGWFVTVLGCTAVARVFARFARDFPQADGPYTYLKDNVGSSIAFLTMWCYWISLWMTNAALATGVVGYLDAIVPGISSLRPEWVAISLVWVFVLLGLAGARTGGGVQLVTTVLKLVPMAIVIALGAWLLLAEPSVYAVRPAAPVTLEGTMAASTIALFAMLGVECATVPAGRVRDPGRTIPRATLAGTLIAASVYVAVSTIPMLVIPTDELARSAAPFADLLDRLLGEGSGRWLAVFIVISGVGAINGWTLLVGELTATMASNGVLPAFLARRNGRGAPAAALMVTGALATVMVMVPHLLVMMSYESTLVGAFTFLTTIVTAANLPLYFFGAIALLVVWRRGGVRQRGELPWISALALAFAIYAFIGAGKEPTLWALALAAAGLPVYFAMRWRRPAGATRNSPAAPR